MSGFAEESLQPTDWKLVENTLREWAMGAVGGIDAVWENQNVPQPPFPYLSLMRGAEVDEGGVDEKRYQTIATDGSVMLPGSTKTPADNREIIYQPIGFTLTVQAHVDFDAGATDPSCDAKALLSKIKRNLGLTNTLDLLRSAGIALIRPEAVVPLDLVVNGEWLSRAALDVRFRTASILTDSAGFVDKVQITSTGVDFTVDAS